MKEEDQFGVWSISLLYFSFVTYEDKFVTHLINIFFMLNRDRHWEDSKWKIVLLSFK